MPPRHTKQKPIEDEVDDEILDDDEDDEDEGHDNESTVLYEPLEIVVECHWQRRSIADLFNMMETPYLELNPDYQRDVVWATERMTRLINSLLCNFYVPPVIFNVKKTTLEDGKERFVRVSIDGKQRLSSIRAFIKGNIPCTDKNGKKWFFEDNGDSLRGKKRILDEKQKMRFLNLELLCAEYSALERKQEEDLFSRVQLGVPLTPAEKLRASSGAWQAFAIDIEKKYQALMNTVDNKRGRSFQLVLQILKQTLNSDEYNPKYSAGAAALKGFCDRPSLLDDKFKANAWRIFETYNEVLTKHPETFENQSYTHATKYSPIEFVGSAILINQYPQRNNPALLSGDILHMRRHLRQNRQDLRSNSSTWKCLIDFVNELEAHRGGANVTTRDKEQGVSDISMADAGVGGLSPFPQPVVDRSPPAQLEMQPAAAVRKKASATKTPPSTGSYLGQSPAPSTAPLPMRPEMNIKTGHPRFQPPQKPLPQPPTAPSAQRQPPTAPLAQRQPPTAPNPQRQLSTAPVSQRQSLPNPQVRAPIAPLGHTAARSVADRFRAVNTLPNSNLTPLFGGGMGTWSNEGEGGGRRVSVSGPGGGYSGRSEYSLRDGNYGGGQRPNKRAKTDHELVHQQMKREKEPYHFE